MIYIYMPYWPNVRSRWLDSGRITFFPLQWIETKSRSLKTGKRTRPLSSLLDRPSLVNKVFTIKKNNFGLLRIKNNLFISRAWKESHCVCNTRNPQESFIFLWFNCTVLSSADFCDSIAVIFQKLGTSLVCPEQLYFLRGIKVGNPERANRPTFPAWVANQNKGFASKCMLKGAARDMIKWLNKETSIRRLWIS